MADRENKSIADILAQARKKDGGESGDSSPPADRAGESVEKAATSAKPAAHTGNPKSMSVADMLAAARATEGAGSTESASEQREAVD